jgi:hypothetical protein
MPVDRRPDGQRSSVDAPPIRERDSVDPDANREARIEAAAEAIYAWQWGTEDEPAPRLTRLDIGDAEDYRQMAAAALHAVGALDG